MEKDYYNLMVGLQWTQKKLKCVSRELIEREILIEGLQKAAEARKRGNKAQKKRAREMKTRRWYWNSLQECVFSVAPAV